MPFLPNTIRVMALGIFKNAENILVVAGYDKKKNEHFFRLPGGGIDFGETSENALRREMREEFGEEISDVQFHKVVENIFTYENKKGHEIIFLFKGKFSDKNFYRQEIIVLKDSNKKISAQWMPIKKFRSGEKILYPTMDYSEIL